MGIGASGMAAINAMRMAQQNSAYQPTPKCPHCGHDLPGWSPPCEDEFGFFDCVILVAVSVGIIAVCSWGLITATSWGDSDQTLVQVLVGQWHWFVGLLHRIW
jgi:hypothetical protein